MSCCAVLASLHRRMSRLQGLASCSGCSCWSYRCCSVCCSNKYLCCSSSCSSSCSSTSSRSSRWCHRLQQQMPGALLPAPAASPRMEQPSSSSEGPLQGAPHPGGPQQQPWGPPLGGPSNGQRSCSSSCSGRREKSCCRLSAVYRNSRSSSSKCSSSNG